MPCWTRRRLTDFLTAPSAARTQIVTQSFRGKEAANLGGGTRAALDSRLCLVGALARAYTANMATALIYHFLEARPKSAYRQLFIKGTRIRAEIIYRARRNLERRRNWPRTIVFNSKPCGKRLNLGDQILLKSQPTSLGKKRLWRQAVSPHLS